MSRKAEKQTWDNEYREKELVWGERPSELAIILAQYLQKHGTNSQLIGILDVGCGYGRDACFLASNLPCQVLGIDASEEAVKLARKKTSPPGVSFECLDFRDFARGRREKYDIIFISNLYHLLREPDRRALREVVATLLKRDGLVFLNTLSVRDPEHYGKGKPVRGEENSFEDGFYMHFSTSEELARDFDFLNVNELYEHDYREERAGGLTHHHVSWILIGENKAPS